MDISSPAPENPSWHLQPGDQHVLWDTENPSGYRNRTGVYKTRLEWDFIRNFLPPAPAQVLDIGGGAGRFALKLGRMGYTLTVNDLHEPSLRLLHERAGEDRPTTVHGEFLTSEIEGTFDVALAIECLRSAARAGDQDVGVRVTAQPHELPIDQAEFVLQASAVIPVLVVYGLFDRLQREVFDLSYHGIQVRYSSG